MRSFLIFSILFFSIFCSRAQVHSYYLQNRTPEYAQIIRFYDSIAKKNSCFKLIRGGLTDVGIPLHLFVISKSKQFNPSALRKQKKAIVMINNGIHPGEPDGIDACINIVRDYALHPAAIPKDVVICIVPVFNIDGALQRNSVMRMNQNGPVEFGFRGNAKNLDLNRDFIKCDAENTRSLIRFVREWDPDVFIDTHVSNGADYPYTMTLICPNSGKKTGFSREIPFTEGFSEEVRQLMKQKDMEICPYVETIAETPDSGLLEFNQTPRYSTGYASLFHAIGFVTESHMLKPYPQRVKATIEILNSIIAATEKNKTSVFEWRKKVAEEYTINETDLLNWKHNMQMNTEINFKGYSAEHKTSSISGLDRLFYNRNQTWEKAIPYFNFFSATDTVLKPKFYVVPSAWKEVLEVLKTNRVEMLSLKRDTLMEVEYDYISDFKTTSKPYEGHYLHYDIKTRSEKGKMFFRKGDVLIPVQQAAARYLVETLEPRSNDGFFAWNFFDAILQQKEGFSDYVFEEVAERILKEHPEIKSKLESAKAIDKSLNSNHWQQLNFIFQQSEFKEKSHNRYPVFKLR